MVNAGAFASDICCVYLLLILYSLCFRFGSFLKKINSLCHFLNCVNFGVALFSFFHMYIVSSDAMGLYDHDLLIMLLIEG